MIEEDIQFQAIEQAKDLGCVRIGWMNELATDEIILATQKAKLGVSVWTVNEINRAQHLKNLGVDGLITDYPQRMINKLK